MSVLRSITFHTKISGWILVQKNHLAKLKYFTNLDFPDLRGKSIPKRYLLGGPKNSCFPSPKIWPKISSKKTLDEPVASLETLNNFLTSRWFKVTFSSPSWRSLNHWKGSLNHPKKVTKNCQAQEVWIPQNSQHQKSVAIFIWRNWRLQTWKSNFKKNLRGKMFLFKSTQPIIWWKMQPTSTSCHLHEETLKKFLRDVAFTSPSWSFLESTS